MRTLSINNRKILVVEVPEYAPCRIEDNKLVILYSSGYTRSKDPLPKGDWNILGKVMEITEEQAKEFIKPLYGIDNGEQYEDFIQSDVCGYTRSGKATALDSFRSLCAKEGIKENDLLLIEQI